ncbi:hypothetical protein AVEN_261031-1 [Araneus ventricosus]|uniref:Uncharacterized protein n=1 Tax=Araneus ventricosus TaxID=182803 RepID=A0A4Y2SZW1_ARAVE|nr:hypothetical protein AVEN_261031-1 [Araneus ventricosus]
MRGIDHHPLALHQGNVIVLYGGLGIFVSVLLNRSIQPPEPRAAGTRGLVIRAGKDFIEEVLGVCGESACQFFAPWHGLARRLCSRQLCIHHCEWKIVHGG